MKLVYVSSPYSGENKSNNIIDAEAVCAMIVHKRDIPIAPHLYLPKFLDDDIPRHRELALNMSCKLIEICDMVIQFGEISEGVKIELETAEWLKKLTYKFATAKEAIEWINKWIDIVL